MSQVGNLEKMKTLPGIAFVMVICSLVMGFQSVLIFAPQFFTETKTFDVISDRILYMDSITKVYHVNKLLAADSALTSDTQFQALADSTGYKPVLYYKLIRPTHYELTMIALGIVITLTAANLFLTHQYYKAEIKGIDDDIRQLPKVPFPVEDKEAEKYRTLLSSFNENSTYIYSRVVYLASGGTIICLALVDILGYINKLSIKEGIYIALYIECVYACFAFARHGFGYMNDWHISLRFTMRLLVLSFIALLTWAAVVFILNSAKTDPFNQPIAADIFRYGIASIAVILALRAARIIITKKAESNI